MTATRVSRLFDGLLSSARKLFGSGGSARRHQKTCRLRLEPLERREVPSAAQANYLFNREVADCQVAGLLVQQASQEATSPDGFLTNGQQALQDLNTAKAYLVDAAHCVIARYQYGYETQAQAVHDLAIINQGYNTVNLDIQNVQGFYSGIGGSVNGVNVLNLPNYYTGANMLYAS